MATWKSLDHPNLVKFTEKIISLSGLTEQQISECASTNSSQTCKFKPLRGKTEEFCGAPVAVPYGFCTKHKSSVQAKQAKELFEKKEKEKEEKKPEPPKETKKNVVSVRKNVFGNWQHSETGIIFRDEDKKAYGVQESTGRIIPLSSEMIKYCKERAWKYVDPKEQEETEDDSEEEEESGEDEEDEEEESEEEEQDEEEEEQGESEEEDEEDDEE